MPKTKNESWETIARDYLQRSCTQKEFCEKRGLKCSTVSYYVSRLKKKKGDKQPSFLPIEAKPQPLPSPEKEVLIEFPNGMRLTIRG